MAIGTTLLLASFGSLAALALLSYTVFLLNGLIRLRNNTHKAWANIDALLKQRNDEVPRLVAVVQGYAAHERTTVQAVVEARSAMLAADEVAAKGTAHAELAGAVRSLLAVAQAYPDLKADASFLALQRRLAAIEDAIAERREFYNDGVTAYNSRTLTFPDLLVARATGMRRALPLFHAAPHGRDPASARAEA